MVVWDDVKKTRNKVNMEEVIQNLLKKVRL